MPAELVAMILTILLATGPVPIETPEPDMLEFLGKFETSGGEWVDPTSLEEPPSEVRPALEKDKPQ